MTALLVAGAGAAGVLARYGITTAFDSSRALWSVLAINVVGSFLLGIVAGAGVGGDTRLVLGVGFLGGFTTFSTFSLDVWSDLEAGRTGRALAVVGASVVLGVAAAAAGWLAGRA